MRKLVLMIFLLFISAGSFCQISKTLLTEHDTLIIKKIRTYNREADLYSTYPKLEKKDKTYTVTDKSIIYIDATTNKNISVFSKDEIKFSNEEKLLFNDPARRSKVIKETFDYEIKNDSFLIKTSRKTAFNSEIDVAWSKDISKEILNKYGVVICKLNNPYVEVLFGPDSKYFIAYDNDSANFYNGNGNLIYTRKFFDSMVKYSPDGNFLICWNNSPSFCYLFNNEGQELLHFDEVLLRDEGVITSIYPGDNGSSLLISASQRLTYYRSDKQVLWTLPAQRITNVIFIKKAVLVESYMSFNDIESLELTLYDPLNGMAKWREKSVNNVYLFGSHLIFKSHNIIYEYSIY